MKHGYEIVYEAWCGYGSAECRTIAYVYDTLKNVMQFVHELNEKKHSNFGDETDEYYYYDFREVEFSTLNDLREIYLGE